jgi:hypothetical protein
MIIAIAHVIYIKVSELIMGNAKGIYEPQWFISTVSTNSHLGFKEKTLRKLCLR